MILAELGNILFSNMILAELIVFKVYWFDYDRFIRIISYTVDKQIESKVIVIYIFPSILLTSK